MIDIRKLVRDARGVTAVEFGIIAPVFVMGLLGCFDLAHNMYTSSMLQGAIQKSARDSTIEGSSSSEAQLDARVTNAVRAVAPQATLHFSRRSYATFSEVGMAEDYTDVNDNGSCDAGEPFEDSNRNGSWDSDRGNSGFGGARDAVLYSVRVTYPRAFPVARMLGQSDTMTVSVATVLRNQPYGLQDTSLAPVEHCS